MKKLALILVLMPALISCSDSDSDSDSSSPSSQPNQPPAAPRRAPAPANLIALRQAAAARVAVNLTAQFNAAQQQPPAAPQRRIVRFNPLPAVAQVATVLFTPQIVEQQTTNNRQFASTVAHYDSEEIVNADLNANNYDSDSEDESESARDARIQRNAQNHTASLSDDEN